MKSKKTAKLLATLTLGFATASGLCIGVSACGHEHDFKPKSDASGHWTECRECEVKTDLIPHADDDNDGKCDECEYVMTASTTVAVTGITLDESAVTLEISGTKTLNATVAPSNATDKTVTWTSSDSAVASVDQTGTITAVAAGTATITATAGDKTAVCVVTVNPAQSGEIAINVFNLTKTTLTLNTTDEETITPIIFPSNATNKTVTWTSSNAAVATVDQTGKVKAVAAGTATVTATAGGKTATCAVTVEERDDTVRVSSVTLPATAGVATGKTTALTATVLPANATNKTVSWASDNTAVATVSGGIVTGVSVGTANITATADGKTATCVVTVSADTIEVIGVTISKVTLDMKVGATDTLTAAVNPSNATNASISWSSSAPSVVSVENGQITALDSGVAKITATAGGKSATCTVTVTKIPSAPQGAVQIIKAKGDLEAGYVTWEPVNGAVWYNVYVKPNGGSFVQLDNPLIREYKDYFRADAVGLKESTYTVKVVPLATDGTNDTETESMAATAEFSVVAHTREGYGFVNGTSSGAYNEDGTIKSTAGIVYVTEATKNTVEYKGIVGVQNILTAMKAQKTLTEPMSIRFIGNISDPADMPKGDLYIDGVKELTLEGIGNDATINGFGFVIKGSSNVEVRNLGFMNCDSKEGDDVGLQQDNDHVWVHNCDMFYGHAGSDGDQAKGDGALDTKKSTYVTHSYNHFWDNGKCNLQGMKDEKTTNYITYHHNWYDHSDSRHPRIRTCTVHVYNNYFDGNAKYGVGATLGSSVFVENNYFRSTSRLRPIMTASQGTDISIPNEKGEMKSTFSDENGGAIKSFNNVYDCPADKLAFIVKGLNKDQDAGKGVDAWEAETRDEKVPATYAALKGGATYSNFDTAPDFYTYVADSPENAKAKVMAYAGRIDGGDFKWEFDNAKDDGDYDVNQGLKSALVAYNDVIVKIGADKKKEN